MGYFIHRRHGNETSSPLPISMMGSYCIYRHSLGIVSCVVWNSPISHVACHDVMQYSLTYVMARDNVATYTRRVPPKEQYPSAREVNLTEDPRWVSNRFVMCIKR